MSGPRNRAKAALRVRNREANANVIVGAALARLAEVLTWDNFMAAVLEHLWARGWRPKRVRGLFMVERTAGAPFKFAEALVIEAETWFQADGAAHCEPEPVAKRSAKKTAKRKAGAQ